MMEQNKPTPRDIFAAQKVEPEPKKERQRIRRHRRATYISRQDEGKDNPFAIPGGGSVEMPPETQDEIDESNDKRLQNDIPPHFGKL
ncbi:hypothetical protein [Mobiluncus curtisii]|uniref:Uncharacterized protein n=3 Tax=Mobiluncus curtisii TaxID=2051 RepID=D6ZJA5_MOBCV|nr:hypothetical protein [Mobiluncus curtisii]ADI66804.1 hypothetical protein HMPREF0573_10485 [Mobiluncus curtisii ATCC 43063]MCU9987107.1 hypothetical protein [Mobiluncus curtisii]MCV0001010.1 hypothetical protein [Mobiluncus curtisii]NMW45174.1 hypothetical protein [Mobiluncus curtisii]NMW49773.1 hypothetical protein [Mobiluncus curtisii]